MHVQKGCRQWTDAPLNPRCRPVSSRAADGSPAAWRASEGANLLGHEGPNLGIVRDRQGPLEPLRLVREIVPPGEGDELVRGILRPRPLPCDLEEVVSAEVDLLGLDRLEFHILTSPVTLPEIQFPQSSPLILSVLRGAEAQ